MSVKKPKQKKYLTISVTHLIETYNLSNSTFHKANSHVVWFRFVTSFPNLAEDDGGMESIENG